MALGIPHPLLGGFPRGIGSWVCRHELQPLAGGTATCSQGFVLGSLTGTRPLTEMGVGRGLDVRNAFKLDVKHILNDAAKRHHILDEPEAFDYVNGIKLHWPDLGDSHLIRCVFVTSIAVVCTVQLIFLIIAININGALRR